MTDPCPGPPASVAQASAVFSLLCPNIFHAPSGPPGEAEIYHEPVVRGRQAAMLLSPPAWQGAGWILCTLSMKPACSCHACLLSMYCAQSGTTSHPRRCRPALTGSPVLGRNTDGCILLYPRYREMGVSVLPPSTPLPPAPLPLWETTKVPVCQGQVQSTCSRLGRGEQKSQTAPRKHLGKEELIINQDRINRKGPAGLRGAR